MNYVPKPINTTNVQVSEPVKALLESLARNAHEIWAVGRINDGWSHGPVRDDARKQHPCLIPYEYLPESEKEYDRRVSEETLKAILALGYQIEKSS